MIDIITIPFKELRLEGAGFKNPRTEIDSKSISELAESIAEHGLMNPLRVWTPLEDPSLHVVIAGSRRYLAIEKLIEEKRAGDLAKGIPCILAVHEVGPGDALLAARIEALSDNIQRENLSSFEIATEMASLKEAGLKGKDIAALLKKSEAWVSRQLSALRDVSENLKAAWKSGKLPDDDVQNLSKLRTEDEDGKVVPDHPEMDKRLDKILAHRSAAAATPRKEAAEARKTAKGDKDKGAAPAARPKVELLTQFIEALQKAPTAERYLHGVRDGLRFAIGDLGPGEFGKEFASYAEKQGFYEVTPVAEPPKEEPPVKAPSAKPKWKPRGAHPPIIKGAAKKTDAGWTVIFTHTNPDGTPYSTVEYSYESRSAARKGSLADVVGENGRVA